MKQWGTVIKTTAQKALVEVCSPAACQKCKGCLGVQREHSLWAANPLGAQTGERVCVELPTRLILGGSVLLYLLPLVLMLIGYGVGVSFASQHFGLVGAAIGFLLAVATGGLVNRLLLKRGALELTIIKVESTKGGKHDEVFGRAGGDQTKDT